MCRTAIFSTNDARLVESILSTQNNGTKISTIITNNPESLVIDVAKRHNIKWKCFDHHQYPSRIEHEQAIVSYLKEQKTDLIVFAHYMRLITKYFVDKYRNKIINIHPSLLPAFKGANSYRDAFDAGVSTSGCTIHYVDEGLDTGDIIIQKSVPREQNDTFETFCNRVHSIECETIKSVLQSVAL